MILQSRVMAKRTKIEFLIASDVGREGIWDVLNTGAHQSKYATCKCIESLRCLLYTSPSPRDTERS
eukprot:1218411-Karenia_brevis.AAC.1